MRRSAVRSLFGLVIIFVVCLLAPEISDTHIYFLFSLQTTLSIFSICRSNIILADCTERRTLSSSDYNENHKQGEAPVTRGVTRQLRQAMVPGAHLIKVEMDPTIYHQKVGSTA